MAAVLASLLTAFWWYDIIQGINDLWTWPLPDQFLFLFWPALGIAIVQLIVGLALFWFVRIIASTPHEA